LKNYLELLQSYFPGRRKVRNVIKSALAALLKYDGSIRGEEFAKLWDDAIDSEHPQWRDEVAEWKGCQGSKANLRGYPCSLWSLWHTLTVTFAHKNLNRPTASANARSVMLTMKDYIQYFFGCSHCSNHFVDMAEDEQNPIDAIETSDQSIMWLWQAHNKVNRRVAGDLTEDPMAPKIQFPGAELCPACHVDRKWNEEAVLRYMKKFYSLPSMNLEGVSAGDQTEFIDWMNELPHLSNGIKSGGASIHTIQWNSLSLTKIDISLCASIYLISSAILLCILGKFLLKRRYRRKLYTFNLSGKC